MKQLCIFIFILATGLMGYTQTSDTSLTKTNVTKILNSNFNDSFGTEQNPVWSICFNKEGDYETADTIQLFSDMYHYLKGNCCNVVEWNIFKRNRIFISNMKVCQEPPMTTLSIDDSNIKLKIISEESQLMISLLKDRKLIDQFQIIAIDNDVMYNQDSGFRITMVRQEMEFH